jgi:hypothetical protein
MVHPRRTSPTGLRRQVPDAQVSEEAFNNTGMVDARGDAQGAAAASAVDRIDFVNLLNQPCPAGLAAPSPWVRGPVRLHSVHHRIRFLLNPTMHRETARSATKNRAHQGTRSFCRCGPVGYLRSTVTSTFAEFVMVLNTGENSARALSLSTSAGSAFTRNLARISV